MRKMLWNLRERERGIRKRGWKLTEIAWHILLYIRCILTSCWHYYTLRNLLSHTYNHVSIIWDHYRHWIEHVHFTWDTLLMMQLNSLYETFLWLYREEKCQMATSYWILIILNFIIWIDLSYIIICNFLFSTPSF